jgi:hypothetical protein
MSAVALIDETAPSICDNQQWQRKGMRPQEC